MAKNFRKEAQARFPWMSNSLLSKYATLWKQTGNAQTAMSELRQTSVYRTTFPGNRRPDGTLRMDENQYYATLLSFRESQAEIGLRQRSLKDLHKMIGDDVSAAEFNAVTQEALDRFREPGARDSGGLTADFVDAFIASGSRSKALDKVRGSSTYKQVFAGNIRDDGTVRMEETDFFAYKRGFGRALASRGVNPEPFIERGKLAEAVESELSIQELNARLDAVVSGVDGNTEDTRDFFLSTYGNDVPGWLGRQGSRSVVLAMAIDPDVGNDLLNRRITAAQIGGEAKTQGYLRNVDRAEQLARAGVTQQSARDFYGSARQNLAGVSATTARFGRGRTSLAGMEDAFLLQDGAEQQRIARGLGQEQSAFTGRQDVRRDQEGRLTGLLDL